MVLVTVRKMRGTKTVYGVDGARWNSEMLLQGGNFRTIAAFEGAASAVGFGKPA